MNDIEALLKAERIRLLSSLREDDDLKTQRLNDRIRVLEAALRARRTTRRMLAPILENHANSEK